MERPPDRPVDRRLADYRTVFDEDNPVVFILAPSHSRPIPAGDTRRGTAWIFRSDGLAKRFASWMKGRHGLDSVPVAIPLRQLVDKLGARDLTFQLDPQPLFGYGNPLSFKAPRSRPSE